jgi:hypothetical protein
VVLEMDTAKDRWSIAAGTYSAASPRHRGRAHLAAERIADKLKGIAAKQLNVLPDDVEPSAASSAAVPPRQRHAVRPVAGTSHWSPVMLPEAWRRPERNRAVVAAGGSSRRRATTGSLRR